MSWKMFQRSTCWTATSPWTSTSARCQNVSRKDRWLSAVALNEAVAGRLSLFV